MKIKVLFLFLIQIFALCLANPRTSWNLSCKPCVSQLEFCLKQENVLIGQEYIKCIENISYSSCYNCIQSIQASPVLWCQESIMYHQLSCDASCRIKGFVTDSYCESSTGVCKC